MDELSIADQLVKSGKITSDEKWTWQVADTEWDDPTNKADDDTTAKVQKLVDGYDESRTPPVLTGDSTVESVTDPTGRPKDPVKPDVPVLDSHGDKGSSVEVSTGALRAFAGTLNTLAGLVDAEHGQVQSVMIRPGSFGAGAFLTQKIQQDLRNDTLNFLQSVGETFRFIQADIEKLIVEYGSTEDRLAMSAQDLTNVFNDAFTNIGHYGDYGNASTDHVGGGNNNGNGNNGNNGNGSGTNDSTRA